MGHYLRRWVLDIDPEWPEDRYVAEIECDDDRTVRLRVTDQCDEVQMTLSDALVLASTLIDTVRNVTISK